MPESKRWTLVKIAGLLSEAFERFRGIVALVSAAGGIGGIIVSYYSLYTAYQAYVLGALAAFVLLVAVLVTWMFATAVFRQCDKEVTAAFVRLENAYLPFEREAVRLFYLIALASTGSVDCRKLETLHADYLEAICNTVVGVFEAKKRNKKPFTANIKRIELSGDSSAAIYVYSPLVRSSNYDQIRIDYDDNLEAKPIDLQTNYVYRKIFDPRNEHEFFVRNDIADLLSEIKHSREITAEPNQRSADFYQSFMVFPILGLKETDKNGSSVITNKYMKYRDKNVFAVMSVESTKRNSFDQTADVAIMTELTSYAFSAFRIVQAIWDLSQKKGFDVVN